MTHQLRNFVIFHPAGVPAWWRDISGSITDLFRRIMPVPFRLADFDTADLPAAADWKQGLVWDTTISSIKWSDGTSWIKPQASDAQLDAIAGLTPAADQTIYWTSATAAAMTGLTAAGRALIDDADAAAQRTTLGLGTIATQAANNVALTGGSIIGITNFRVEGTTPIADLRDTDTSGSSATGYYTLKDSASVIRMRLGKPFVGGALYIDNTDDNIHFAKGGSAKLTLDTVNSRLDLASGFVVRINSVQILTARQTGWGAMTGTAARTAAAVHAAQTITNPPTQAEVQNIDNSLVIVAQRLKALIDDLTTHGLIGA